MYGICHQPNKINFNSRFQKKNFIFRLLLEAKHLKKLLHFFNSTAHQGGMETRTEMTVEGLGGQTWQQLTKTLENERILDGE